MRLPSKSTDAQTRLGMVNEALRMNTSSAIIALLDDKAYALHPKKTKMYSVRHG